MSLFKKGSPPLKCNSEISIGARKVRHPQAVVARLEKTVVARERGIGDRHFAGRGTPQPKSVGGHGETPALQRALGHEYFKLCAHGGYLLEDGLRGLQEDGPEEDQEDRREDAQQKRPQHLHGRLVGQLLRTLETA